MKIIYHLILSVSLFFSFLVNYGFTASIEGNTNIIDGEQDHGEELSFNDKAKENTLELKSAEDKQDKNKTIKELKNNIADLHSNKINISKNFNDFVTKNGNLRKYFKVVLNNNELESVEKIVVNYNSLRLKKELILKKNAQQGVDTSIIVSDLLSLKKDLYISFLPYIQITKLEEYKAFIKIDLETIKQDKNIQSDIYKKEKIVEEKKSIIQEKIQSSELDLEEKRNRFIQEKINKKLNQYASSPRFQSLSLEKQKFVFGKVLKKISDRRIKLESIEKSGVNTEKIKLFKLVEGSLEKFITNLK